MSETQFEVGDRVRIEDPGNKADYPTSWFGPMDGTIGCEGEIRHIFQSGTVNIWVVGASSWTYATYHLTNLTKEQTVTETITPDQAQTVRDMRNTIEGREALDALESPHYVVTVSGPHALGAVYQVWSYKPDSDGDLDVTGKGPAYIRDTKAAPCDVEGRILEWGLSASNKTVAANTAKVYVKASPRDRDAWPYAGGVYQVHSRDGQLVRLKEADGNTSLPIHYSNTVLVEGNWDDAPAA